MARSSSITRTVSTVQCVMALPVRSIAQAVLSTAGRYRRVTEEGSGVAYNEINRKEISPMKALIPILLLFGCAIAPAEELSPAVVANLRAMGPAGLQKLLDRAASDPAAGESPGF